MLNVKLYTKKLNRFLLFILICLALAIIASQVAIYLDKEQLSFTSFMDFINKNNILNYFSITFLSIIIDSFPFIMIGVLISSLIQIFVTEDMIARILPKNKILGLVFASTIGIVFPVCDCAIIPIARRFAKKGVPLDICITFLLSVPIVNPISIMATYYAFPNKPIMVLLRCGLGILTAIIVGYIMGNLEYEENPIKNLSNEHPHECNCGCGFNHSHSHYRTKLNILPISITRKLLIINPTKRKKYLYSHKNIKKIFFNILNHINIELYNVGKYLIFGAFLSSLMQTFVAKQQLLSLGKNPLLSIIVMQLMAFVLSICSTADAFIARTFLGQFTTGSVLAFLILGPMLDIKNTFMLSDTFKPKFLIKLILWILLVSFALTMLVNIAKF